MFAQRERPVSPGVWFGVLCLYLVATRWPLAPHYLYYFDSANFALALDNFNPALHQPQPPGYPLFVAFTRLIHLLIPGAEQVFLIAGLLAACAAVVLIRNLAREMFGPPAGLLAAALLASNPVFWFGGITNQIRLFLAVGALAVALAGWRALRNPDQPRWLYAVFGALALAGGFRPNLAGELAPFALFVWWRCGRRPGRLALGLALAAAVTLPWLAVTIWASGGPVHYVQVLREYADSQFENSSALYGAAPASAWHMARMALVWNLIGVVAWIWAVPFVWRSARGESFRRKAAFLTAAFLPSFLFSAFVHIGDPDQALATVSILCVAGGGILARFCRDTAPGRLRPVMASVVVAQTLLFFYPPTKLAKASSYKAVAAVDRMTTDALTSIQALHRNGPLTIVHYGSLVASRQLAYYFPDDYVVVLPPTPSQVPQIWHGHRTIEAPGEGEGYLRPDSTTVVCLLPWYSKGEDLPGWQREGPVYYHNAGAASRVEVGPFTLIRHSS